MIQYSHKKIIYIKIILLSLLENYNKLIVPTIFIHKKIPKYLIVQDV